MTVNLSEAKAHLGRYVARANAGETVTICERNKPLAELVPVRASLRARKLRLGILKGKFEVPEEFNEPLTEFEAAFYDEPERKTRRLK